MKKIFIILILSVGCSVFAGIDFFDFGIDLYNGYKEFKELYRLFLYSKDLEFELAISVKSVRHKFRGFTKEEFNQLIPDDYDIKQLARSAFYENRKGIDGFLNDFSKKNSVVEKQTELESLQENIFYKGKTKAMVDRQINRKYDRQDYLIELIQGIVELRDLELLLFDYLPENNKLIEEYSYAGNFRKRVQNTESAKYAALLGVGTLMEYQNLRDYLELISVLRVRLENAIIDKFDIATNPATAREGLLEVLF